MTCKEWIEIILAVSSFVCAVVSIIIVIITIRQNNKILEESSRPIIAIYSTRTHNGNSPVGYLVIKNCGHSAAVIEQFNYDHELTLAYVTENVDAIDDEYLRIDWLKKLKGDVIAPGQLEACFMDFSKLEHPITFEIKYKSGAGKTYHEEYKIDLKAGSLPKADYTPPTEEKALSSIAVQMNEIVRRQLL